MSKICMVCGRTVIDLLISRVNGLKRTLYNSKIGGLNHVKPIYIYNSWSVKG